MSTGKTTLVTNATALMVATIATSVIGLAFWALAVRLYDTADVGIGTAQISAATLVATLGQLSLGSVFTRFVPNSGRYKPWIVRRAFTVVAVFSMLIALVVVGLGFADTYLPNLAVKVLFVAAVPVLALFIMQDTALLGLGSATVVPIENVLFSIAKLALLPVLAITAATVGVFVSWIVPAGLAVVGVGIYIHRKHLSKPELLVGGTPLPPRSELWPMLGKQYIGTLASQAVFLGVPLIIIHRLGANASGYLSIAWVIGGAFGALMTNITQSFAYEVRKGQVVTTRMMRHLLLLLGTVGGLGGLACAALAPLVLMILAPGYAAESTTLLRLVSLSMPFQALLLLLTTFWWLEGKFALLAIVQSVNALLTLCLTWYLAPSQSVTAPGTALLATSLLFALGSAWPIARRLLMVRRGEGQVWTPAHVDAGGLEPSA